MPTCKLGDFAIVYSCRTGKSAYAIAGDDGNDSGAEGSLALVQALGYNIVNGIDESVDDREIVLHYFPHSNPGKSSLRRNFSWMRLRRSLGLKK